MPNKNYIVTLRLFIASYEKTISRLVIAANETKAGQMAILDEAHNELDEIESGLYCDGGEMCYKIERVKEICKEHAEIVKNAFSK